MKEIRYHFSCLSTSGDSDLERRGKEAIREVFQTIANNDWDILSGIDKVQLNIKNFSAAETILDQFRKRATARKDVVELDRQKNSAKNECRELMQKNLSMCRHLSKRQSRTMLQKELNDSDS